MMIILLAFASSVLGAVSVLPMGCIYFICIYFRKWLWLCWRIRTSATIYLDALAFVNFSLSLSSLKITTLILSLIFFRELLVSLTALSSEYKN